MYAEQFKFKRAMAELLQLRRAKLNSLIISISLSQLDIVYTQCGNRAER
jgi:hypothetical protein